MKKTHPNDQLDKTPKSKALVPSCTRPFHSRPLYAHPTIHHHPIAQYSKHTSNPRTSSTPIPPLRFLSIRIENEVLPVRPQPCQNLLHIHLLSSRALDTLLLLRSMLLLILLLVLLLLRRRRSSSILLRRRIGGRSGDLRRLHLSLGTNSAEQILQAIGVEAGDQLLQVRLLLLL